jgi:hypothetical protein
MPRSFRVIVRLAGSKVIAMPLLCNDIIQLCQEIRSYINGGGTIASFSGSAVVASALARRDRFTGCRGYRFNASIT